mgnify:CR=1 FL=1
MPRVTITEKGVKPQPYRLKIDRESTKIGRSSENDITLKDGSSSTYHCVMKRVDGGFILEDTNSTNGLKIEDTRYAIIDLEDEMIVHLGDDIELKFQLSEEELDILDEEDFEPHQKIMFPKSKQTDDDIDLDDEDDEDEAPRAKSKPKRKKKTPVDIDEDDEDEDDDRPRRKTKSRSKTRSSDRSSAPAKPVASSKGSSPFTMIFFLILALVFLAGGMAIRHYQDHGTFIFSK